MKTGFSLLHNQGIDDDCAFNVGRVFDRIGRS